MVKMDQDASVFLFMKKMVGEIAAKDFFQHSDEKDELNQMIENKEFRRLIQSMPCIVMIYNFHNAYYEFVSDNIKEHLGFDARMLEGEQGMNLIFQLLMGDQTAFFLEGMMKEILTCIFSQATPENGKDFRFTCCFKIRNDQGQRLWYMMDTSILQLTKSGQPLRTLITFTNVDPIKKDNVIYYDVLKKDDLGKFRPVLQRTIAAPDDEDHILSDREYEIMQLISKGYTNIEIAETLFISQFTVQTHRRNIKKKLKAKTTSDIINYALVRGIV